MNNSTPSLRRLSYAIVALMMFSALLLAWAALQKQESTLAIRSVNQGTTMPDGFSIWHHLDANGIQFKSITPQNDVLLRPESPAMVGSRVRTKAIKRPTSSAESPCLWNR